MFSPRLVHEFLRLSADRLPDKTAVIRGEDRLRYRELDSRSDRLARVLAGEGVRRHDRVVIFLDNSPEAVISLFGVLKAGGVFVILNTSMKGKKLGYILRDSGAAALIAHPARAPVVEEALRECPRRPAVLWAGAGPAVPGTGSRPWEERDDGGSAPPPAVRSIDLDLAALIYTSGSTGEPKGVMSTHQNLVSAARSIIEYIGNTEEDVIVDVLPLSFDYGLYQVLMSVMFGGTVVFESFLFPVRVLQVIEKERVTGFPLVPTVAAFLLKLQDLSRYDLRSLRYMTNTGAALPAEHIRRLRVLFPAVSLFSMFGLTECKRVCFLPPGEVDRRPSSVGKAMPHCEVFVVDEDGNEVAPGQVGELVIRGANVMRGYWNAPDLTEKVYRPGRIPGERWLFSGDYFRRDEEGFLYFLGRKDDMIKTKGERVSPKEVENVLCEMEGVAEAAVIGVPDELLGEAIVAFVVPGKASSPTERDVLRHCSERLEAFMLPKHVVFLEEMPKSPHGKIDKSALRRTDRTSS